MIMKGFNRTMSILAAVKITHRGGKLMKMGRIVSIAVVCIVAMAVLPFTVYGADKLLVKDGSAVTQFVVTDTGHVGIGMATPIYMGDVSGGGVSKSQLHFSLSGVDSGGYVTSAGVNNFFVSSGAAWDSVAGGWVAKSTSAVVAGSGAVGYRIFLSNACTAGAVCAGLTTEKFKIDYSGNVTATSFTPSSSKELKNNIQQLSAQSANEAFMQLEPVTFTYKVDPTQSHVGFIAEDVPSLVATKDRKTINPVDIIGVLTKVLQDKSQVIEKQQNTIDIMAAKLDKLESDLNKLKSKDYSAQK